MQKGKLIAEISSEEIEARIEQAKAQIEIYKKQKEVNAFQTLTNVMIQKSIIEGFGLVVSKLSGRKLKSSLAE